MLCMLDCAWINKEREWKVCYDYTRLGFLMLKAKHYTCHLMYSTFLRSLHSWMTEPYNHTCSVM